jgi:type IV secretory pathway VirB2 component (pilin)
MKKYLLSAIFAGFLVFGGVILPNSLDLQLDSQIVYAQDYSEIYSDFEGIIPSEKGASDATKALSHRIKTGQVGLADIIIIIVKMIDLITKLAGTIAVLMLIYGGYQYMIGSISDDKEGAKKTIQYAIMGLVVTFLAYVIVNLVQTQFLGK